ncbi:MAG: cation:proton antiporter domain-containing protein, partial [Spirochaetota bacterium]
MDILDNILLIFALSIVVIYICNRLKIPTIIGLLITGLIVGPYGFGFIKTSGDVELLARIGVIVLLFTIGLELSFDAIASLKRAIIAGIGQVLITIAVVVLLLVWSNDIAKALFYGFIVSLSSTAIVLKIMDEYALTESPQGRIALAILIVQDIAIVPLMLFIPLLVGNENISIGSELFILLGKGIVVVGLVIVLARYIIPRFLYEIARTRSRELFIISVVTLCLAITFATHSIGLSVELGAFLAGVIVAASEYSGQTFSSMIPFRDLFTSFFFISIGMLLNPATVITNVVTITGISLAIIFIKFIVIMLIVIAVGYPLRIALLSGFYL